MTLLLWPAICPDLLLSTGSSDSSRLWLCFDPDGRHVWGLSRQPFGNHSFANLSPAGWGSVDDAQLLELSSINMFLIYLLVFVLQIYLADLVLWLYSFASPPYPSEMSSNTAFVVASQSSAVSCHGYKPLGEQLASRHQCKHSNR